MAHSRSCILAGIFLYACVVTALPSEAELSQQRDSRIFNLQLIPFVTINVDPAACSAKSDNSTGTCSTKQDCSLNKGKADGSCADGYGVCCVYEKRCGSTVNKNITYLVNDAYPDSLKDVGNCHYSIEKVNLDVCQLRLDFLSMTLKGPATDSTCSTDTFTFVGTAGANPTVICGHNTGQHMYLDLAQGMGAARINVATTDTSIDRSWRIKVTQIPCNSINRAPTKCLQYYTDYSGTINSFNYQADGDIQQLADQRYTACIRARQGFCGIRYTADDFSLSADSATPTSASGDTDCKEDFVLIPSLNKDGTVTLNDRFCGSEFVELITYSQPFEVRVVTDNVEAATDLTNKGFSIRYTQIPC